MFSKSQRQIKSRQAILEETLKAYPISFVVTVLSQLNTEFRLKVADLTTDIPFYADTIATILTQVYTRLVLENLISYQKDHLDLKKALKDFKSKNNYLCNDVDHLYELHQDPEQICRYLTPQEDGKKPIALAIKDILLLQIKENSKEFSIMGKLSVKMVLENPNYKKNEIVFKNKSKSIACMVKDDLSVIEALLLEKASNLQETSCSQTAALKFPVKY